ncbi:hypothetical protein K0T92_22775 [Paenibacillus oenotherae]|uniref:Aminoglycoside phosphotransferase domain-containing protein n=1 Tax=Paenibacillus oenotherae TaxID=1435645 RepID=A0ABS7DEE5_9BACL|nr:hypothetical protein [Paenibacillus oenotherae]MBW7477548.1 hypothetical protein [Paenibacillus oenotherae]
MNLQSLFSEQIISQTSLGGRASDVWQVKTENGEYVVRSSGVNENSDAPFLWACRNLFGIELQHTYDIEYVNDQLGQMSTNIDVPRVIQKGIIDGRQFIVVEKMNGTEFRFLDMPPLMMEGFGMAIADIHSHGFSEYGAPAGTYRNPVEQFPQHLSNALSVLSSRYYNSNIEITSKLQYYCSLAENLPLPGSASYVMLDMDARQFLAANHRVTAIVDTEAYVLGPRELDLVAIECSLDKNGAASFKKGYAAVLPFPDLSPVRDVYRFLFCLLEIKGPAVDYNSWLSSPRWFDSIGPSYK